MNEALSVFRLKFVASAALQICRQLAAMSGPVVLICMHHLRAGGSLNGSATRFVAEAVK